MSILSWLKIAWTKPYEPNRTLSYKLKLNDQEILNTRVIVNKLHHETYKTLRHFKKPIYDDFYLLRNAKSFNTYFFSQKYDLVVCDKNFNIIELFPAINQNQSQRYFAKAYFIYFCPLQTINFLELKHGDELRIFRDLDISI